MHNYFFNDQSNQDQVEIRKSRFENIARSGFLDLKKSGVQEIRIRSRSGNQTSPTALKKIIAACNLI